MADGCEGILQGWLELCVCGVFSLQRYSFFAARWMDKPCCGDAIWPSGSEIWNSIQHGGWTNSRGPRSRAISIQVCFIYPNWYLPFPNPRVSSRWFTFLKNHIPNKQRNHQISHKKYLFQAFSGGLKCYRGLADVQQEGVPEPRCSKGEKPHHSFLGRLWEMEPACSFKWSFIQILKSTGSPLVKLTLKTNFQVWNLRSTKI